MQIKSEEGAHHQVKFEEEPCSYLKFTPKSSDATTISHVLEMAQETLQSIDSLKDSLEAFVLKGFSQTKLIRARVKQVIGTLERQVSESLKADTKDPIGVSQEIEERQRVYIKNIEILKTYTNQIQDRVKAFSSEFSRTFSNLPKMHSCKVD